MQLTVYFDGSFWCGLIEYEGKEGDYQAINYIFGPEPKDSDLESFVWFELPEVLEQHERNRSTTKGSIDARKLEKKKINPKRMQRRINKEKRKPVFSTKAQLAIKETQERSKQARKTQRKEQQELEKERKFELKQMKKREKQKGH